MGSDPDYTEFYGLIPATGDERAAAARSMLEAHGVDTAAADRLELRYYDPETMLEAREILQAICAAAPARVDLGKNDLTKANEFQITPIQDTITMPVVVVPISASLWAALPVRPDGPACIWPAVRGHGVWNQITIPATSGRPLYLAATMPDALAIEAAGASAVYVSGRDLPQLMDACRQHPPSGVVVCLPDAQGSAGSMQGISDRLASEGINAMTPQPEDLQLSDDTGSRVWAGAWNAAAVGLLSGWIEGFEGRLSTDSTAEKLQYRAETSGAGVSGFMDRIYAADADDAIPTGIQDLDTALGGGMLPGLYILGAESSVGKTSLAIQMAYNISDAGNDVLFFSCEQSADELTAKGISRLTKRVAAQYGQFDRGQSARSILYKSCEWAGRYPDREIVDRAAELYAAGAAHLWIIEADVWRDADGRGPGQRIGLDTIQAAVKRHHGLTGRYPVVFVDYLQILMADDPTGKRSDKQLMDDTVTTLRGLAKSCRIPVFAISALNRTSYGGPVEYQSFKESGSIEYSSDVLMGLFFDGLEAAGTDKKIMKQNHEIREASRQSRYVDLELRILKNRIGPKDTLCLQHDQWYGDFMPRTKPQDPGDDCDRQRALDSMFDRG